MGTPFYENMQHEDIERKVVKEGCKMSKGFMKKLRYRAESCQGGMQNEQRLYGEADDR